MDEARDFCMNQPLSNSDNSEPAEAGPVWSLPSMWTVNEANNGYRTEELNWGAWVVVLVAVAHRRRTRMETDGI